MTKYDITFMIRKKAECLPEVGSVAEFMKCRGFFVIIFFFCKRVKFLHFCLPSIYIIRKYIICTLPILILSAAKNVYSVMSLKQDHIDDFMFASCFTKVSVSMKVSLWSCLSRMELINGLFTLHIHNFYDYG